MNSLKTLSFTTAALLAASAPADAYFQAALATLKEYRQDSTNIPVFRSGSAEMYAIDGVYTFTASCRLNFIPYQFFASTVAGCNIGANAVVVDTIRSSFAGVNAGPGSLIIMNGPSFPPIATPVDQEFFELVGVEEAQQIEPGYPDRVKLVARTANSEFPAVIPPVTGIPMSIFYDLKSLTGNIREFKLGAYFFSRSYTSRKTMEKELVQGSYDIQFPTRGRADVPTVRSFPVVNTVEGYVKPGSGVVEGGFRFTNVGPFYEGFAQYDPRVNNMFQWQGLDQSLVRNGDRLYFNLRSLSIPSDPTSPRGAISFPPGTNVRILLDSPVQSSYALPAGFFLNNDTALVEVTLERDPGIGLAPVSRRLFQLPIVFRETFAAAMTLAFPLGTASSKMAKDADPDGDGVSNWIEWLSGTDPTVANAPRSLSPMTFVAPSAAKSDEPASGYYEMTFPGGDKKVGASVDVESSTDLKTWAPLSDSDPEWKRADTYSQIRIISKTATLGTKRYFRVALAADL